MAGVDFLKLSIDESVSIRGISQVDRYIIIDIMEQKDRSQTEFVLAGFLASSFGTTQLDLVQNTSTLRKTSYKYL